MRKPNYKPADATAHAEMRDRLADHNRTMKTVLAVSLNKVRAPETEDEANAVLDAEFHYFMPLLAEGTQYLSGLAARWRIGQVSEMELRQFKPIFGATLACTAWQAAWHEAWDMVEAREATGRPFENPRLEIWRMMYADFQEGRRGGKRPPRNLFRHHFTALRDHHLFHTFTSVFGEQAGFDVVTGAQAASIRLRPGNASADTPGEVNRTERLVKGLLFHYHEAESGPDALRQLLPGIIAAGDPNGTAYYGWRALSSQVRRDINALALPAKQSPIPEGEPGAEDPELARLFYSEQWKAAVRRLKGKQRQCLELLIEQPDLNDYGRTSDLAALLDMTRENAAQLKYQTFQNVRKILQK